ncbi:hypothetical protein Ancab_016834 [Ancistrocladus abbreviatus]
MMGHYNLEFASTLEIFHSRRILTSLKLSFVVVATISPALVKQLRKETGTGMMDCKMALTETGGDIVKAQDYLRKKGLGSAEKKSSKVTAEGRIGEKVCVVQFGRRIGEENQDFAAEVAAQTAAKPSSVPLKEQPAPAATEAQKPDNSTFEYKTWSYDLQSLACVVPKQEACIMSRTSAHGGAAGLQQLQHQQPWLSNYEKKLEQEMMVCKKALSETGGDLEKAHEHLRNKGLSTAEEKSSPLAAEGSIGSYTHDSPIVVACPQFQFVSLDDIPQTVVSKEIEMQRDDILSKPENIRGKIVERRVSKRLGELALLEQAFIKNDRILAKDLVKQTVAALGENIKSKHADLSSLLLECNQKIKKQKLKQKIHGADYLFNIMGEGSASRALFELRGWQVFSSYRR